MQGLLYYVLFLKLKLPVDLCCCKLDDQICSPVLVNVVDRLIGLIKITQI